MKVLLVEDNIIDLNGIHDFVPWKTLECEICAMERDGEAGLKSAEKYKPDLIISDISMPLMDGITMCKKIRKFSPEVHIIFLTCLEKFDCAHEVINMGNCEYITKPVNVDSLVECILKIKDIRKEKVEKQMRLLKLEQQIEENRPYFTQTLLKDIIVGNSMKSSSIKQYAADLKIDTKKKYTIIYFEMHVLSIDILRATQVLFDVIDKHLTNVFGGWNVDLRMGVNVVAVPSMSMEDILDVLSEIQRDFLEVCDAELTICIGKQNTPFLLMHQEYERIESAIRDKFFYTPNSIVFVDELCTEKRQYEKIDLSKLKNDIVTVLVVDEDEVIEYFVDKYLKEGNVGIEYVGYIVLNLSVALEELNVQLPDYQTWDLWLQTHECKSYTEVKQLLTSIIKNAKEYLKHNKKYASGNMPEIITDIIEKEYSSIETLEDVTDRFGLNALYINRLFKNEKGETIYEYLVKMRLNKAKELLATTQMSIAEIGYAVGYKTARYFNSVFKQKTCMTPGQYRKINKPEE